MKLEVLLSVLNLKKSQLNNMNITSRCTVINQCSKLGYEKYKNFYIYSYPELGLSISRNRGLENVCGDIILLCDDDVVYDKDYERLVLEEFSKNPSADVIIFNMERPNRKKRKITSRKRLHIYNCLHYASCNIAFRKDSIINHNITFNPDFGSGGYYNGGGGEDTLFLVSCLKQKLKIYSSPINLGVVYHKESTWFDGYNEKYFYGKGALFTAISHSFRYFLFLQFLIRHPEFLKTVSFFRAFSLMCSGSKDYINYIHKH